MSLLRTCRGLLGRLTLTQRVALMSLVPMVLLGFALTRVIEHQVDSHSIADAGQSARLIASIGIQPRLTPRELRDGLTPNQIQELDEQLRARSTTENLARIKIWNAAHRVVYSDDHRLIGRRFQGGEDLDGALAGHANDAQIVTPEVGTETASEVGLGKLVEVYVPLRFASSGPPVGAFEIYLSYRPVAAAIARDKRLIVLVVAIGLALLWAILFRIVAQASRRLRRQARENYELGRRDPLTGLPNRMLFRERVGAALDRPVADRDAVAVLLIDIDGFTRINSTLGNATGDAVLGEAARRLQAKLGTGTLVARIGADEYAILCPHADGIAGALRTGEHVQSALELPIVIAEFAINVDASIGVAVLEGEHEGLDELLQHADAALARAVHPQPHRGLLQPSRQLRSHRPDAARRSAPSARARRVRAPLPTEGQPAQQTRDGRRGAASLAPPRARAVDAAGVHRAGRADGARGGPHAARRRARARADGQLARAGHRSRHVREPVCAQPARHCSARSDRAAAAAARAAGIAAVRGGH